MRSLMMAMPGPGKIGYSNLKGGRSLLSMVQEAVGLWMNLLPRYDSLNPTASQR